MFYMSVRTCATGSPKVQVQSIARRAATLRRSGGLEAFTQEPAVLLIDETQEQGAKEHPKNEADEYAGSQPVLHVSAHCRDLLAKRHKRCNRPYGRHDQRCNRYSVAELALGTRAAGLLSQQSPAEGDPSALMAASLLDYLRDRRVTELLSELLAMFANDMAEVGGRSKPLLERAEPRA